MTFYFARRLLSGEATRLDRPPLSAAWWGRALQRTVVLRVTVGDLPRPIRMICEV